MKTFVLFGSTGDLATRYVLPALGKLLQKGVYDHLVCVGRRDWSRDDFRNFLAHFPDLLSNFEEEKVFYVKLDIESDNYSLLKDRLIACNGHDLIGTIISHLCLSPEYFVTVARGLASIGLGINKDNSQIMIEKPFGYNLESANDLNLNLKKYFSEDQIYRIDHYLGKNFVQELYDFRLNIDNKKWSDQTIKEICIVARETLTLEGRGEYYDKSGATRDFLQNHLLQILSIAIMEPSLSGKFPYTNYYKDIQKAQYTVLKNIKPLLTLDARHDVILGQYEGYLDEPGVNPISRTETYIRVHLKLDNPWKNTDIVLETGKALNKKESSVKILFHDGTEKIFSETAENKNNSYETLIKKAFDNDLVFFVPWENVEAAWQVVNDLLHCTDNCPILKIYPIESQEV